MKQLFSVLALFALAGAGCTGKSTLDINSNVNLNTNTNVTSTEQMGTSTNTGTNTPGQNSLSVATQDTGAKSVIVTTVSLQQPGYIVIHADDNGSPGAVLGQSALLQAGTHTNISVPLSVKNNTTYWAMLHTDNGNGTYATAEDAPTTNGGVVVMVSFVGDDRSAQTSPPAKDNTKHDTGVGAGVNVNLNVQPSPLPKNILVSASIQNFAYAPATITVKKGDKITFTNKDSVAHTVTADGGAFSSALLNQNQQFTLDTSNLAVGTYGYYCEPHPNMKGTIIVQ